MQFDQLLTDYLGDFGPYQRRIYALVCLPAVYCAIITFAWTFTGANIPHRCKLDDFDTDYHSRLNTSAYLDIEPSERACFRPVANSTSFLLETCKDGYLWDNSDNDPTALQEWNLVCDQKWITAIVQSIYYFGFFIGSALVGYLSDRYGRKIVLMVSCFAVSMVSCLCVLAPNVWVFLCFRFVQGLLEPGVWQTAFVIGIELVGPSKRLCAGLLIEYFFSAGMVLLGILAYYIRSHWKIFQIATSAPGFIFLAYYWLVPESARWLLASGRKKEAIDILKKAAKTSGISLPEDATDSLQEKSTLCIVTLIYYGISLNPSKLAGDFYTSFILSSATEFLAVTFLLFTLNHLGRRAIQAGGFLLSGLALILVLMVPAGMDVWVLLLVCVAKVAVVGAFCTIYLYTSEIFPTVIRSIAIGLSSTCARVGGIASPFASLFLDEKNPNNRTVLLVVFGTSSIIAALLTLMLPETTGKRLPETLEDGETFGNDMFLICSSNSRENIELGEDQSGKPLVQVQISKENNDETAQN